MIRLPIQAFMQSPFMGVYRVSVRLTEFLGGKWMVAVLLRL